MYSIIKTFLDIDNNVYCCSKKAIKMNIPIQTRERLNRLDYYMMCICYYIFTFTMIFTILNYNLFPLTIIYFIFVKVLIFDFVYLKSLLTFVLYRYYHHYLHYYYYYYYYLKVLV
jgi:hypothetical protein